MSHAEQTEEALTRFPFSSGAIRMLAVRLLESASPVDSTGARALFESIVQWGILQPLIVRPLAGGRYDILAGRKRFAAAVSAGLSEVPCLVFEGSDLDASALAVTTNPVSPVPVVTAVQGSPTLLAAVLGELQATRAAIATAIALADSKRAGLRQQIARELVDIELQRASWVITALTLMNTAAQDTKAAVKVGPLLRAVASAFQPECRAGRIEVRLLVEPPDLTVLGTEAHLRAALDCLAGSMLTSMHGPGNPDATLMIQGRHARGGVVLTIAQNVLTFEALSRIRAGARRGEAAAGEAVLASFGLDAAKRGVEAQGGRLTLRDDPAMGGGAVDLTFPASPSKSADSRPTGAV